ncbi:MAG: FAD-linked oxidase C-terminal domain-containing protein, partial [Vicinamibacterales bacterium]
DTALVRLCRLFHTAGVLDQTELVLPGDRRRADQVLAIREAVPTAVNQRVGLAKRTVDPAIEKTAGDMIVPFPRLGECLQSYRDGFERRRLDYAIWGHLSDANLHPNVIPRSAEDVRKGQAAILEFGRQVIRLGGCPLAEHGVGRSPLKQALLKQLYGDEGIEQMRRVKQALDPEHKLAPGVLFPERD